MQKIIDRETGLNTIQPLTWGISLDAEASIVSIELVSRSPLDPESFLPAQILSVPVQKAAAAFVMVQYDPHGLRSPDEADKAITARLISCGEMMRIPLLDHLIVSGEQYYSFRSSGLIDQLSKRRSPQAPRTHQQMLEDKINKAMEEKEKLMIHIAVLMQEAGKSLGDIMTTTGLSIPVIIGLENIDGEEIDPDSHFETELTMD